MCVSNHRSRRTAEASGCPGPSHNLCGNHSWSSSFLWQHLASSWIPKKVREHGNRPYTIITEEAHRARERKECSEGSGGGGQASYCNHLVQQVGFTGLALPQVAVLLRIWRQSPVVREQKRSNWVTLGKYLNGNCNWLGGTLAGEVLWV